MEEGMHPVFPTTLTILSDYDVHILCILFRDITHTSDSLLVEVTFKPNKYSLKCKRKTRQEGKK
jgi:hypothetical protein